MADAIQFDWDDAKVLEALSRYPDVAERHLDPVARLTSETIVRQAQTRLQRQLGPNATGATVAGIHFVKIDGGYQVNASHSPNVVAWHTRRRSGRSHTQLVTQNNLPLWLDRGTRNMASRPFWDITLRLEEAGHERRIQQALASAADEVGLGD
jgi:hypothetical protein